MKKLQPLIKFWHDESGQNTMEYILMVAVIFLVFSKFKTGLLKIVTNLLGKADSASNNISFDEGGN